jgi:hypothetical protein
LTLQQVDRSKILKADGNPRVPGWKMFFSDRQRTFETHFGLREFAFVALSEAKAV